MQSFFIVTLGGRSDLCAEAERERLLLDSEQFSREGERFCHEQEGVMSEGERLPHGGERFTDEQERFRSRSSISLLMSVDCNVN